jgi:RimJ/RimL family protein N-acetyltransferase
MLDVSHVRTQRLLMRRWRDTDLEPFRAMNADPEVMRHFPAPLDREASDRLVERFERHFDEHSWGVWALEESRTGRFLGFTGLNPLPDGVPGAGEPEVGWRLARHAWHQGYATEAALAAVDLAAGELAIPVVWSITAVANEPSQAVMRRIGLVRHSFFEHPRVPEGHPVRPHVAYRSPDEATT